VLLHAHFGPNGVLALPLAWVGRPPLVTFYCYGATTKREFAQRASFAHRNYIRKRARLIAEGRAFIAVPPTSLRGSS